MPGFKLAVRTWHLSSTWLGSQPASTRAAPVQAIVDGVDVIAASQALNQLSARTSAFVLSLLSADGIRLPPDAGCASRVWYNPSLKSLNSIVPGLIAVVLYMPAWRCTFVGARKRAGYVRGTDRHADTRARVPVRQDHHLRGLRPCQHDPDCPGSDLVVSRAVPGQPIGVYGVGRVLLFGQFWIEPICLEFLLKNQQAAMLIMIMVFLSPAFSWLD